MNHQFKNKLFSLYKYYSNLLFGVVLKGIFIRNNPYIQAKIKKTAISFYKQPVIESFNLDKKADIFLFTVAFNSSYLIEKQIIGLKAMILDSFHHIIIDNCYDLNVSRRIKLLCSKYGVGYIKLPINSLVYSDSHGAALSYVYKNFIKDNTSIPCFGFLDHDILPLKKTSLLKVIDNQDIYGVIIDKKTDNLGFLRGKRRFLWGGFCFFKNIFGDMDFMPNKSYFPLSILDTGGSNWVSIYSKYILSKLCLERYLVHTDNVDGKLHKYWVFGDWIHFWGGDGDKEKIKYLEHKYHLDEYISNYTNT